ncbi:cold shock domain-containing protein [Desulfobacter postgatei]|uniref:cold-shock protein n=1 Tax=Desulfobacter postgatei TaxID=2293 RepID=UPI00259B9B81|nr:cold shock domain-containing protein [uncultured Desulfobacter sp.]
MVTGTVESFNETEGNGLILEDSGKPNIFVHHSGLNTTGSKSLNEGDKVSFDVEPGENEPNAVNVTLCPTFSEQWKLLLSSLG